MKVLFIYKETIFEFVEYFLTFLFFTILFIISRFSSVLVVYFGIVFDGSFWLLVSFYSFSFYMTALEIPIVLFFSVLFL